VILDSSAVVAVLIEEPGWEELEKRMREAEVLAIGAPTLMETNAVMARRVRGEVGRTAVARFSEDLDVVVIPFAQAHCEVAVEAYFQFGKGRHPAALNYGDCMAYATARIAGRPLLFIGNDFARTDIERA
jgi:ribonuclease VapC